MHLMYTLHPETGRRVYTLQKIAQGQVTKSAHPARFSPDDKFSRQRVTLKKRYGMLLTQQTAEPQTTTTTMTRVRALGEPAPKPEEDLERVKFVEQAKINEARREAERKMVVKASWSKK